MPYSVNHTDTSKYGSLIVEDKTVNTDTSIKLIGQQYAGYAKIMAENLIHMMENFASKDSPVNPIVGQLWYDTNSNVPSPDPILKVWNGSAWSNTNNIIKATTTSAPTSSITGTLLVDMTTKQLKLWSGTNWLIVGPTNPTLDGSERSEVTYEKIWDSTTNNSTDLTHLHLVSKIWLDGKVIAIISPEEFTPQESIDGFLTTSGQARVLLPGINLATDYILNGTANISKSLLVVENNSSTVVEASDFFRKSSLSNGLALNTDTGLTLGVDQLSKLSVNAGIFEITNTGDIKIKSTYSNATETIVNLKDDSVTINKPVTITGDLTTSTIHTGASTITGLLTASGDITTPNIKITGAAGSITPAVTNQGLIGTDDNKWLSIISKNVSCDNLTATLISGLLKDTVKVRTSSGDFPVLSTGIQLQISGDIQSTGVPSQGNNIINFTTKLNSGVISTYPEMTIYSNTIASSAKLLIDDSGVLKHAKLNRIANPVGTIILHASASESDPAPTGYLLCDGSLVSITAYNELHSIIGSTYGAGTGTFGLPTLSHPSTTIRYYIYTGKWS